MQDIIDVCSNESRKNSESKVFVLCILSHGQRGSVFGTDGQLVEIEHLEELFDGQNCEQLIGRPKVFLIQACQGGQLFYSCIFVFFTMKITTVLDVY